MAKPKCPSCGMEGTGHIVSERSEEESGTGDEWFSIVYCDNCGYVYGVFAKHVLGHTISPLVAPPNIVE